MATTTTTIVLQCVIDHSAPLPEEGRGMEKTLALALMGLAQVEGARVSRCMTRDGEPKPAPEPVFIPEATGMRSRAAAELALEVARMCPSNPTQGGPHEVSPMTEVCIHCGQSKEVITAAEDAAIVATGTAPQLQAARAEIMFQAPALKAPEPVGKLKLNPRPDPNICSDGQPHDFDPSNANRGRVCPRCGAANPAPPPRPAVAPTFANGTLME